VIYRTAVAILTSAFGAPLPGPAAQELLAPVPRREWPKDFDAADVRDAAGLLLVYPRDDRAHVVLTVRADSLGRHGGQVSMPGGVVERGESVEQAALREAHEEVNLERAHVNVLGTLTPLDIPVSGFRLHPVVASVDHRPVLHPSDREVARILEIPIAALLDPARFGRRTMMREGRALEVPAFLVEDVEIWGATAMALAELLCLLDWPGPSQSRST